MATKTEQLLIEELKLELDEDRSRFDEGEEWFECALDAPSNDSEVLQQEIATLVGNDRYVQIMNDIIVPYMRTLR